MSGLSDVPPGRRSIGLAIASACLFGASTPFAKALVSEIHPLLLAGLLYLGSGVGLAALLILRRLWGAPQREAALRRADMPWLGGAILAGGVVGPGLLMIGLTQTTASSASLLLNLEGLATMGIAWLVFRENVDRRVFAGAMAILAGAIVLSWPRGDVRLGLGALAIAGACLAWGVDNNLTRKLSAGDPIQIAMVKGLAAGLVNLSFGLLAGARLPDSAAIFGAAGVGLLGYGVSLALFIRALRDLGTARTGAYFSTAPFVGALLSVIWLGEPVSGPLIAAGALMGVGVYLHLSERHEHEHEHEEILHEHAHSHDEHHQHPHSQDDPSGEPHVHWHRHAPLRHRHPHYPDLHHRHAH